MEKSPDAFRTISEVADWLGVQAHVLRFWESKFTQVRPVKRAGGRRYYRPSDMRLLGGIKKLLHEDGMTIKGVQKLLREQGVAHVSALSLPLDDIAAPAGPAETVIPFQAPPAAAPPPRSDAQIELGLDYEALEPPQTAEPEPDRMIDVTPGEEARAEPVTDTLPPQDEPEKAGEAHAAAEEESAPEEPIALPRFRHRADPSAPPQEPAAPPRPSPRVVDAPDPPPETEIDAAPGPLTRLAAIRRLTPEQARALAPLAKALADWRAAAAGDGKNA